MTSTRMTRRAWSAWALGTAGGAIAVPGMAQAQASAPVVYPQPGRPIRLLVGLAAGGSLDTQARAIARRLGEMTGVQVIVDNKPGASMMLSATELMRSAPDGHTLLYGPSSLFAQNPHTLASVPWVLLEVSLTPYNQGSPLIDEVLAWMRARGFGIAEVVDLSRDRGGRLVQADLLFQRLATASGH